MGPLYNVVMCVSLTGRHVAMLCIYLLVSIFPQEAIQLPHLGASAFNEIKFRICLYT